MKEKAVKLVADSVEALEKLSADDIVAAAELIVETFRSGGKVLLCGNGGSAADCQHIAAEFVGRYKMERNALHAVALTTDTSILTALANDYGGGVIFSRQVEALGVEGDVLLAFSTSGTSPNVLKAVESAKKKGMMVIGFTGSKGKKLAGLSDVCIMVDSEDTPRIQEGHITAAHVVCGLVEEELFGE